MMMLRAFAIVSIVTVGPWPTMTSPEQRPSAECQTTQPNRHSPPDRSDAMPAGMAETWFGNSVVGTALWADGEVVFKPGGPGTVLSDGALRMKFFWLKTQGTRLVVTGNRSDDASVLLRSDISHTFDSQGFQPSYLIFATPGCWRVTARAGDETLSFVTLVVKIGNGPVSQE
jgi:hypothetical protein